MPQQAAFTFAYHQSLMVLAAAVCLFGTWVGMRHFARARATQGPIRYGWLFMASVGTGAALWATTFISILALDQTFDSAFDIAPTAGVLLIGIIACLAGFEIGSRPRPALAPELGGLVMGLGIIAMHYVGLKAWHVAGHLTWSWWGVSITLVVGLGLSALSVSRANRPVTRYCRHGAAIVMTVMICAMHYAMAGTMTLVQDAPLTMAPDLMPARMLSVGLVGAVLLVIGSGFSSYIIDLRTRTESANRIHQLSFNDTMTGLPNRIAFNERLAFSAAEAHEIAHKLAAFSIDIDGFKDINDLYGHSAGDMLLIAVADRMRRMIGPGEFLARQSGDEFLALQMSGNHPHDAEDFASRLASAFTSPFDVQGHPVLLTASIGYSIFPTDTPERDQVLSNAKLAMQRSKAGQRGNICAYHREMEDASRARRALSRDLQGACERGELLLHYQLQTELTTGAICGAEALMRWRHPRHGMVSPSEFIPLAEQSDAILAMGGWALRTACHDAAAGRIPGTIAVNLSPRQLNQDNLAEMVHGILIETGLSPRRLEIEVTESTFMSDQAHGLHILRKLKSMGISIAMDDFGTGYSSLATLHAFPFDKIKLDQSFVRRIPEDAAAAAIVTTVMALGRSLGTPVLAEGIETRAQWDFLVQQGCAKGQGYLFARPVAVEALPAALIAADRLEMAPRGVATPGKLLPDAAIAAA